MGLDLVETLLKQFKIFSPIVLRNKQTNKQIHLMIDAQFDTCSAVNFPSAEIQVCVQYISGTKNNSCEILEKTPYLLTPWSRVLLEKLTSKLCS